jgi:hypothetical protein
MITNESTNIQTKMTMKKLSGAILLLAMAIAVQAKEGLYIEFKLSSKS